MASAVAAAARDTIFALSTAPGRAALAIVRASGPATRAGLAALLPRGSAALPPPRVATRARLTSPGGDALDDSLVLLFPAPHSFTGEDVVELHVHGGPAVVAAVLDACGRLPVRQEANACCGALPAAPDTPTPSVSQGWRPAAAGEFTRRAVHAGKMDLTAAEGLSDLLAAQTGHQRRVALAQAGGALHRLYLSWQEEALQCLAHAEAVVDFGEEAHLGDAVAQDVAQGIRRLRDTLAAHVGATAASTGGPAASYELTQGACVRVTLGGAPNAGKSSLFNALLGRDAAIVSPAAGTTRDVLTHGAAVGPSEAAVALTDTAGLRHVPGDEVEAQGVVRAAHALRDAHVRVLVIDAAAAWAGLAESVPQAAHWAHATSSGEGQRHHTVVVLNKADLVEQQAGEGVAELMCRLPHWVQALTPGVARGEPPHPIAGPWLVSTLSGAGLSQLTQALGRAARDAGQEHGRPLSSALLPAVTRARHAHALRAALAHLDAAAEAATRRGAGDQGPSRDELIAEELRSAHVALCTVTGKVHCTEDVLDAVFRDFCIGK